MIRARVTFDQPLVNLERPAAFSVSLGRVGLTKELVRVAADLFFTGVAVFHLLAGFENHRRRTPLGESHTGSQEE